MSKQKDETTILLDADVVIHFIKGGYQMKLVSIFPGRLVMLDKVKQELMKRKSEALGIENFLNWSKIPVESIPSNKDIIREYARLIKFRGAGESACMAVARFRKNYIASSNLKDIRQYCLDHGIKYYSTMDILEEAIVKGVMSEADCNQFITEVLAKKSKLPVQNMQEYYKTKKKEHIIPS
jgi:predicted nucleic acid-binding protein